MKGLLMASKYDVISRHLQASRAATLQMKFSEIAALVGELPASAREHREGWSNNESHTHARNGWLAAGWKTAKVDMAAQLLTFVRVTNTARDLKEPPSVGDGGDSGLTQIEHRAGGAANLLEILRAVEQYVRGEIAESELGRGIRRFWGRSL
jgi:hypothetical protein